MSSIKDWDTPFGPSEVICKDSLQVPETCKENQDSFTSLEEAAEECIGTLIPEEVHTTTPFAAEYVIKLLDKAFIAGAEWQKEQMMKEAFVDNYVVDDGRIELEGMPLPCLNPIILLPYPQFQPGDKVKLIIVKEDDNN